MSLQALCGSPWFITSAVVLTTSFAMLYRRVVISYGRAQSLHAAFFILVCFGLMLVFNFPFRLRHSIYDVTEGKTSGPWRPEWGTHKSTPGANTTSGVTTHTDEVSAYILSLAKKHNLPRDIPFFTRRIQPKTSYSGTLPPSLTTLKSPFLPSSYAFQRLPLNATTSFPPPLSLPLGYSKSPPVDASPLLFAISTTYARLVTHSLPQIWSRFLTSSPGISNGATLLLLLHGASPSEVAAATRSLRAFGIDASVAASHPHSDTGGRYAQLMQRLMHARVQQMLAPETTQTKTKKKEWFVLLNDDVFLPRPGALLRELHGFDSQGSYLVAAPGSPSDWTPTASGALTTAGGAALFLTAGMVDVLGQLLCLQDAKKGENDALHPAAWDTALVACLERAGGATMHVLPGLLPSQHRGALPPLAMHPPPEKAAASHAVTAACGEACWLQTWVWKDGWVVVNGREVTRFRDGVEFLPDDREPEGEEKVAEGVVVLKGPREKAGGKRIRWKGRRRRTWRVLDAEVRGDGGEVWQVYVNRRTAGAVDLVRDGGVEEDGEEKADVDSLVVLIWEGEK